MLKFIHAADIHLDSPLKGLERYDGAPVDAIRGATRSALANLVQLAISEKVDFVLIAGDLYDGDWRDYHTGLFLAAELSKLREAGIRVFVISGNHDAASQMTKSLELPANVRRLSDQAPESVRLDDLGVVLHGQSFPTRDVQANLAAQYPLQVPGAFNIGLLHTAAGGSEGHERYAPCTLEDLEAKGYDYWALGHVHRREVLRAEAPCIVFSGNIQGRHVRETGAKGCLLVAVDGPGRMRLTFQALDVLRWEVCRIDATGAVAPDDVVDRFADLLPGLVAAAEGRPLAVRALVEGASAAHARLVAEPDRWLNEFRVRATDLGGGTAWLECLKLKTTAAAGGRGIPLDGPLAELESIFDELSADPAGLAPILDELRKKLPPELLQGDLAVACDDAAAWRELVAQSRWLLEDRLLAGSKAP